MSALNTEEEKIALEEGRVALEEKRAKLGLMSSEDGGSNGVVCVGGYHTPQLPKNVVLSFVVGDYIDNWFVSYDRALIMHRGDKHHCRALL